MRCQIVDDNDHFLRVARDLLEREGITVVGVASTSVEALRQARELRPDVTLVDIDLGEESGFDLARRLASARGVRAPGVILISGHTEGDFADMIADSPALAFLPKSDLSGTAIRGILARGDEGVARRAADG